MRFSVVVPVYNRADTIGRAIDSILGQDDPNFEVVVVDDGSTDGSAAVVAAIGDPRIRTASQPNAGAGAARNAGVRLAVGELLTFLDSDDEALPGWLAAYRRAFEDGADIVSCAVTDVDVARRPLPSPVRRPKSYGARSGDVRGLFVHGGTYALRRSIFEEVGGFAPGLLSAEHTELAFRLLPLARTRRWVVASIDDPYIRHTVGTASSLRADDENVMAGAAYMLAHHRAVGADRRLLAGHATRAGVRAARLGRVRDARRYFAQACRARPSDVRNWLRLVTTASAVATRRVWARSSSQ